jgi:hypothetical protein
MDTKSMFPGDDHALPGEVRELLHLYREALPEPDASAGFMPGLWARIDARRSVTYSFGRLARAFVTAAVLMCIALSGTLFTSGYQSPSPAHSSYIDVLADDAGSDDPFELQLASTENI